jgi:2-succinyl-5-enolpyruvyl-6-hydroxy-3-cyclohexene-1-carboxylate synthase
MSYPNRATLWGETIVGELVASGVDAVCVAPGSRSTPLTVAAAAHDDLRVFSHLDERSAAYFALGRSRRSGTPTALVCTSGTAAANFHPAVVEASNSRVPLLVLTADRPAELQDSGANQTIDQADLYGDAVRYHRTLPEPAPEARRVRSLRVTVDRAVREATGTPPGPVHLDVPLAKPLEPTPVADDVPAAFDTETPLAATGSDGPFVATTTGRPTLDAADRAALRRAIDDADRPLVVCGPANRPTPSRESLAAVAQATGVPVLADPLSGVRFGPHVADATVLGGYDTYVEAARDWPAPDLVLRFGASPTSKPLREYLRDVDTRQVLVDPAGAWREAEFTATDLVTADPDHLLTALADDGLSAGAPAWTDRFRNAEDRHWETVERFREKSAFEGSAVATALEAAPDPATVYVSNSMPVRDLDRFGRPTTAERHVLGNRGASGIDGVTSSALGAASAAAEPTVLVTGDLAYYHDMNGLLAGERCDVDATIVVVNNDGGGIFHALPIEDFDPPFTEQFKTPHGLDFAPTGDLYDLDFQRVETTDALAAAVHASTGSPGLAVVETTFDAEASHRTREDLAARVVEQVRGADLP